MNQSTTSFRFSLELVAMVAVIAISSWHVGNYMNTFDGWLMAAIMGATLGYCNFLMAHNIFKPNSTSRVPSFCGLIFFACTSTYMQYTYFNADPNIGKTLVMDINMDALALGIWAPAAEILLGWIYAAGLKQPISVKDPTEKQISKFARLAEAFTTKLEQQLTAEPRTADRTIKQRTPLLDEGDIEKESLRFSENNGALGLRLNTEFSTNGSRSNGDDEQGKLSKEEAMEGVLEIYLAKPEASYEEIGRTIGRSKATVANYVKELKEQQRIRATDNSI